MGLADGFRVPRCDLDNTTSDNRGACDVHKDVTEGGGHPRRTKLREPRNLGTKVREPGNQTEGTWEPKNKDKGRDKKPRTKNRNQKELKEKEKRETFKLREKGGVKIEQNGF